MRTTLLSVIAAAVIFPAIAHAQAESGGPDTTQPPSDADPFATEPIIEERIPASELGVPPTFMVWGGFNASDDYYIGAEIGARWRFVGVSVAAGDVDRNETPPYLNDPLPAANIARTVTFRRPSIGANLHGFYDVTPSLSLTASVGMAQRKFDVLDVNKDADAPVTHNLSPSGKSSETLVTWGAGFWWGGNSSIVVGAGFNSELGISAGVGYRW